MREKLTNNLKLKIIAVLFAAGLWMISININDPYQSKDYTVAVQLLNMNVMTSEGKYVEVINDSDEISVRVRGNRSVMDTFTASNIVAVADINDLDENNQIPIKLSTVKTSGTKIESIRSNDTYVEVKVEELKQIQKRLEVTTKNVPEGDYILGKVTTEQNALKISGPETAVNAVEKAVINFDLAGATEDVSMLLPIELLDADGNRINDNRLTMSINKVQCEATILATKEIPLVASVKGTAAKGYEYTGEVVCEPYGIVVAAKPSVLRGVNKYEISDPIDIQGATATVEEIVDIREYLPENVIFADATYGGKVKVRATVEKIFTKEVEILPENIDMVNVPEGYKAELLDKTESMVITVNGYASAEADFKAEDVKIAVDVTSFMSEENKVELSEGEGNYMMDVEIELPEGLWSKEKHQREIKISKK